MIVSRTQSLKMALLTGVLLAAQPVNAMPVLSFDFTPAAVDFMIGGMIDFDTDSLFDDFTIDSPVISIDGLMGEIGGAFTFSGLGEVTSTSGTFEIDDGAGDVLTGALDFDTIGFANHGPLQIITLDGSLDFNTIYSGSNTDLLDLSNYSVPLEISVNFLYSGLTSLTTVQDLFDLGSSSGTPFLDPGFGSVTALPEPGSLAFLGLGIFGIGLYGRRWRHGQARNPKSASAAHQESYSL